MRTNLKKCKSHLTVFSARIDRVQYNRLLVKDVLIYEENGETIRGHVGHCLVAITPFKGIERGKHVRFTGLVHKYTRLDGSVDYSIKIKNVKKVLD